MGHQGDVVVSQGHAPYYEMAYRSTLGDQTSYIASTGVAGVAPGTALSTTPPFALWNPANSGKNLYLIRTRIGYVSGTLGLGQVWYAQTTPQSTKPTGGTQLTVNSSVVGNLQTGAGQAFQGSVLAAVPTILMPSQFQLGPYAGAGASINVYSVDEMGGSIIIAPGSAFIMQAVGAAGTTPLMLFAAEWGEEKI
jgi:hypothetical protein